MTLPPACITRYKNNRNNRLADRLAQPAPSQKVKTRSQCTSRSSIKLSKHSTLKAPTEDRVLNLVEAAYVQLCGNHAIKPNSGILNYLRELDINEGCALTELDTNDNFLGRNGFRVVMDLVQCSQRLRTLKVAQQEVNTNMLSSMLPVLNQNLGLVSVDLSSNPLSIAAARMIGEFVRTTRVEELKLDNTQISLEWRERVESRLQDIRSKRVHGVVSTPIYRPARVHGTVYLPVIASDLSALREELTLLQTEIFPHLNSVLQPRGVTVLPWLLQYADSRHSVVSCIKAIESCTDPFNFCLPWVVFLCNEVDATKVIDSCPLRDPRVAMWDTIWHDGYEPASELSIMATHIWSLLDAVEPPPPLTDKNGNRRKPLREQVPPVHVFHKGIAPAAVQRLMTHRLCAPCNYDSSALPSVFSATVVSRLLTCFDKVYSSTSSTQDHDAVVECSEVYYPPRAFAPAELYNEESDRLSAMLHNQWHVCDGMLAKYEHRLAAEQELMGYCVRYEPEGDCTYPLVMYGQAGAGKATLLAWLARELRAENVTVIPLFIGAGRGTSALSSILRELIVAVRRACDLPQAPILEEHSLLPEWVNVLTKEPAKRVVVLIAGVDLVDDDLGILLLPLALSTNIRVVASIASHSKQLAVLRARVPHPYEVLLTGLHRQECLKILHSNLQLQVPGLATAEAEEFDEGVIKQPSNAADAVCFKDHGTYPLYLVLLARVLENSHILVSTAAETLAFITELPETIHQMFVFMIERWENTYGREVVSKVLNLLVLSREGFYPSVVLGVLQDPAMEWDPATSETQYDPAVSAMLWADLLAVSREHCSGMRSLIHLELARVIKKKYPFDNSTLEKVHSALSCFHFRSLVSPLSSAYLQDIALYALPKNLLLAGRVVDAFTLVTDISFVERKLQAKLFWDLLEDTEKVEREVKKCMEAFIDGFEVQQLRPSAEINTLRAVRAMCIEKEDILRAHPSAIQVCLNLPSSNECHKNVQRILEIEGSPHPLLKWTNMKNRATLASSTLNIGESVVHVSFPHEVRDDGMLLATTHSAVYVCSAASVIKKLQVSDKLSAPPDGYLASVFTPDSVFVVTSAGTQVVIWRWEAQAPVVHNLMDMAPSITRCLSFDGITIVATQLETGKGAIIETRKGRVISTLRPHADNEPVRNIFYAAASHVVVSVGISTVCVYNGPDLVTYSRCQGVITCCDISPDGKVAACCDDKAIHLWSAVTGNVIQLLEKHIVKVQDVSFHPNGHLLASCDVNGVVWVWSSFGQEAIRDPLQTGIGAAYWVGFTPGGGKLLARCHSGAHIYDMTTFSSHGIVGELYGRVTFVAAAPDMTTIAISSDDGTVQLFGLDDRYPDEIAWSDLSTVLYPTDNINARCDAHCFGVQDMRVSQDGRTLVTIFRDGVLKIWNTVSGKLAHSIEGEGATSCVFVRDSQVIVVGTLSAIKLLDYVTGSVVVTMPACRGLMGEEDGEGFRLAELSPDCTVVSFVAHSSVDKQLACKCHSFNIPQRRREATFGLHTKVVTGLRYCGSEYLVTASRDSYLRVWKLLTQGEISALKLGSPIECLDLVDSQVVAGMQSGEAVVVELVSGEAIQKSIIYCSSPLTSLQLCGNYLLTCCEDSTCKVWDRQTGQCITSVAVYDIPSAVVSYRTDKVNRVIVGGSSGYVYQYSMLE